ncbi:MAG: hypothetical protein KGH54_00330 [Candidatus Micrarchaeota archaeon]|nr:hypothetical protein [Candidatus Micrarchaeota archaeon]
MEEQTLVVRRVSVSAYKKLRQKAIERGVKLGTAVAQAFDKWAEEDKENKINPRNLVKITGIIKTGKKVRWSTEADRVLYGFDK